LPDATVLDASDSRHCTAMVLGDVLGSRYVAVMFLFTRDVLTGEPPAVLCSRITTGRATRACPAFVDGEKGNAAFWPAMPALTSIAALLILEMQELFCTDCPAGDE
jgi:hypothetical protein